MFRKTYIEITNICNHSCDFCPGTLREKKIMEVKLFQTVLEQLRGYSRLIHFHVMGEPLLHPDIATFLDLCLPFGYRVNLVTNGILLPVVMDSIINKPSLRQISISLHHLSGSDQAAVDSYFSGIEKFIRSACSFPALFISLRLWNDGDNGNIPLREDIMRRIAEIFSIPFPDIALCTETYPVRLAENIWLNSADKFEWPDLKNKDYGSDGRCLGLSEQIAVLVDGTVTPCCLDHEGEINFGNISSMPLIDILKSRRAASMRKGFSQGKIVEDLCRRCSYRQKFKI